LNGLASGDLELEAALGHPLRRALIQFGGIFDPQLFLNPGLVAIHRGGSEMEPPGDFARVKAATGERKDFALTVRKPVPAPGAAPSHPQAPAVPGSSG